MYYRFLFLFVFLLSTFSSHGQTSEGVAEILFPTDIKLQKTIQLIGNTFDFKKKGAFWELSASGNNRKESNKNRSSINPKGQISNYSVELKLDYAINYKIYDIEKMYIDGTGIPLFGKNTAKEQLQAIHEHPSLLYEANKDGTIKRIQIRKMKAIAFLTYSDGNLVNIQLSYDKYGSQRRRFLNSHAKAKIKIACEKQFTPISLEDRIDVTGFEPTCIAHCDPEGKRNPHVMYGNFVFNGPIKNKLPDGEGKWTINTPCTGYFNKKYSGSIQYGSFKAGIAEGWHIINKDSVKMEYYYEDGIVTAVKGVPILLPFDGIGYLDANLKNGVYQDNEAVIRTGEDHKSYVKMVYGEVKVRNNQMKYYDKNGSFVTLYFDQTGEEIIKVVRRSPNGKITLTEHYNSEGEIETERQLEVDDFDLRHPALMPQSLIAVGDVKVDLANGKWGGENLRISFPENKNLSLTGSFIPAYFYRISTAPTGKHVFQTSSKSYTATYENGSYVSGDEIYQLKESYPKVPMTINFNRETNPTAFYSYQDEITIPLPPKAYGIAFERPVINEKGCTFEYMFNRTDGKLVHWLERSLDGGEIISYDRNGNIGPNKRKSFNYTEVIVRRKDCKGQFIRVYLFE